MTDAQLIRHIERYGYSIWDDTTGDTARRLIIIAQKLERDEPPPIPQSGK